MTERGTRAEPDEPWQEKFKRWPMPSPMRQETVEETARGAERGAGPAVAREEGADCELRRVRLTRLGASG